MQRYDFQFINQNKNKSKFQRQKGIALCLHNKATGQWSKVIVLSESTDIFCSDYCI